MHRILLSILFTTSLFGAKYLAVLDLELIGLNKTEGKVLTSRLISQMIAISDYTIVERTNIEKILKEQKFQNFGCTDSECAVEIGRIVQTDYIIIGTVSKLGSTYNIDVKMIDVAMGNAVSHSVYNHNGEIDTLLTEGIVYVASELSGSEPDSTEVENINDTVLIIDSDPKGAEIYIDDEKYDTTPQILTDFAVGIHKIMFKLDGYENYGEKIRVKSNDTTSVKAQMNKISYGYLDFYVYPENATVLINESPIKNYSIYLDSSDGIQIYPLKIGKYDIEASKPFHRSETEHIIIREEEYTKLDFFLKRKSLLKAKMLAWVFPGLGHFYAENKKKGYLFSVLEAVSLSGTYLMHNQLSQYNADYKVTNKAYLAATEKSDILNKFENMQNILDKKNIATIGLASFGSASLAIWVWNIIDVKHFVLKEYYKSNKVDLGLNNKGQVELQIAF